MGLFTGGDIDTWQMPKENVEKFRILRRTLLKEYLLHNDKCMTSNPNNLAKCNILQNHKFLPASSPLPAVFPFSSKVQNRNIKCPPVRKKLLSLE